MNKEGLPLKDLPIEELVERYLFLPNDVAADIEDLPEDLDYLVVRDEENSTELRDLVLDGILDPESADNGINKSADFLKENYPEHTKSIDIIYLFNRGKIWVAHAMYLSNISAHRSVIERAQEKSARLFLRTGLAIGVISPLLSSSIYNALSTSGHQRQAEVVREKSFVGTFLTKNKEEAVKLAQEAGEKNPMYYREGIVLVNKDKLDKSGLN
jgi:hypothetical protein